MPQSLNYEAQAQIKNRLSRLEGQLRGVIKMIDEERDCKAIIQQLIAIRAGVQAASIKFVQDIAKDCVLNNTPGESQESQKILLEDLIEMMGKLS